MAKKTEKPVESIAEQELAGDAEKPARGRKYVPRHGTFKQAAEAKEARENPEPPKAAKAPKPGKQRAKLQQLTTDGDLVDIWERRILNPFHNESIPIRIKTPGMELRWINLANRGRFQRARYEQGWVPVSKEELIDEREIFGGSYTSEGYVCRGEKQGEMLMKIPTAVFKQIQKRRAEMNTASYKKLRQNMASAGAKHFNDQYGGSAGDQAADIASKFRGDIKFGTERESSTELFE